MPISNALYEILRSYKPPSKCIWLFPSPTGKRWDTDNFSQDLRKINKANSLDWSCLAFRHTFGSHLAQKGESLYKISKLMGNSKPDLNLRFKYFQTIEGDMVLPEGFIPSSVSVDLKPSGRGQNSISQTFNWLDITSG